MNKEIYYFSGTGNSFIVARDIAIKINAKLIPIVSLINQKDINITAEIIGFVFPVYASKPPRLVIEFVKKMRNINFKYIFAISTYGLFPSKAIKIFDQIIKSNGGKLCSGFAVKMPHNGLGSTIFSLAEQEKMFKNWKSKLEMISKYVNDEKKEIFETSDIFFSLIFSGLMIRILPFAIKLIKQVILKGWKSLALISNEKCDGCGLCKKICPTNNIEIINNKPSWLNHCIVCGSCFHWCPKDAIQFGNINMNIKQYHHPEAKIIDILKQKNGNIRY